MTSWSGSIEIGVTECDPEVIELPACATSLFQGTWIMTNCGIVHNGARMVEMYGIDLSTLEEGNTLGVLRTANVCCNDYTLILVYIFYFTSSSLFLCSSMN